MTPTLPLRPGEQKYDYDQVYNFIVQYWQTHGVPPRYRAIMAEFGITSTSVASYIVNRLAKQGKITLVGRGSQGMIRVTGAQWIPPEQQKVTPAQA
jgi:SOS-response transcriptional repressor LexA